jgi:16S rRNA (cytidine1402-2'-O)-methyltransferase
VNQGALYIVSTPIGNLQDITVRAIEVLGRVHVIACEDTRNTRILLRKWDISTRLMSLHRFSENRKTRAILQRLEQGQDVALVSDAGTPAISDPGSRLVRAAQEAGHRVIPIPGPSSITAAISVSGMDASSFVYLSFVPRKREQKRSFFEKLRIVERTALFLEAPLRVKATLRTASEILGTRRMVLLRELTKMHEEILSGTAETILAELETRPEVKGEIIVVVESNAIFRPDVDISDAVKSLMAEGLSGKRLADEAHERFGVRKGDAYDEFLRIKRLDATEIP